MSAVFIAGTMFFSLAFFDNSSAIEWSDAFLRIAREAAIFVVLVTLLVNLRGKKTVKHARRVVRLGFYCVCGIAALVVVQSVFFALGKYVGIPASYFIANGNTVPGWRAYQYFHQRPMGTYGEPSYAGYIFLSFVVMFYPYAHKFHLARLALFTAVFAGILTRSLGFLVALTFLAPFLLSHAMKSGSFLNSKSRKNLGLLAFLSIVVVGSANFEIIGTTLGRVGSDGAVDVSSIGRIVIPIQLMGDYIASHPVGMPFVQAAIEVSSAYHSAGYSSPTLDNAVFNFFFAYGIFGFGIFICVLGAASDWTLRTYLFLAASFNGAFLSVDKLGVICLVVVLYESGKVLLLQEGTKQVTGRSSVMSIASNPPEI
tara:strand:+ start:3422 stop:4531 length:1110 start_codon:yes stop_codon:yes gene_type:complete